MKNASKFYREQQKIDFGPPKTDGAALWNEGRTPVAQYYWAVSDVAGSRFCVGSLDRNGLNPEFREAFFLVLRSVHGTTP